MLNLWLVYTVALMGLSSAAHAQSATTYTYDALGRLVAVRDGTGSTSDYAYDQASNRSNVATAQQFSQVWLASSLYHSVGHADPGAWAAAVEDPFGHMVFGPYTYGVISGNRVAAFQMSVDNNDANNSNVVILDVFDAATETQLASRLVTRYEWSVANNFQVFEVPFYQDPSRVSHPIEFRVYYLRSAYVRVNKVGYR